jgi:phosphoribosylformylglycinamidine (FGAM) synthase PurS component
MTIRIQVEGAHQAATHSIVRGAASLGFNGVLGCRIAHLYFLSHHPGDNAVDRLCRALLVDPVMEHATWRVSMGDNGTPTNGPPSPFATVEVAYRPGVTDVAAREAQRGMVEIGLPRARWRPAYATSLTATSRPTICANWRGNSSATLPCSTMPSVKSPYTLGTRRGSTIVWRQCAVRGLDDAALLAMSKARLLSLDLAEMRTIQRYYERIGARPHDVELETLAQTWSEHCVHKTFKAQIDFTHGATPTARCAARRPSMG